MFNFWPFNIARKRREEAEELARQEAAERDGLDWLCSRGKYAPTTFWTHSEVGQPKRNTVVAMDDPRHPRNLTPQQRADALAREAAQRAEIIAELQKAAERGWPKRNKVTPMDDPRHPRNLTPEQRAKIKEREAERQAATQRDRYAAAAEGEKRADQRAAAFRKELAAPYGVQQQQPESVVREFRCDHPAISEFWQEQQARCDSPADTSSPSCDAPSSTD